MIDRRVARILVRTSVRLARLRPVPAGLCVVALFLFRLLTRWSVVLYPRRCKPTCGSAAPPLRRRRVLHLLRCNVLVRRRRRRSRRWRSRVLCRLLKCHCSPARTRPVRGRCLSGVAFVLLGGWASVRPRGRTSCMKKRLLMNHRRTRCRRVSFSHQSVKAQAF